MNKFLQHLRFWHPDLCIKPGSLALLICLITGIAFTSCTPPVSEEKTASVEIPTSLDHQILGSADATPATDSVPPDTLPYTFPYQFSNPDNHYKLPDELREVSAMSFVKDDLLALVQDEKGKIFIFNATTGEIIQENKFEKKGDYEGIEIVGDIAYVLRSDGDIYKVEDYLSEDTRVTKYENALRTKNDAEGLGYDPKNNWLLISCKASPHLEEERGFKGHRAVYAFDLDNFSLIRKPYLLVNLAYLQTALEEGGLTNLSKNIIKAVGSDVTFQPSAIATHPISGYVYLVASVGKLLLVIDRHGELVHIEKLKKKLFNHPEGICFMPDGTLFISNEGDNGKGNILRFPYLPN